MLQNRRYEDYEELGRQIQETLNALQPLEWNLRSRFQEAFEREASAHSAFASRLMSTPMGRFYSPLYSKEENEGM